MLSLGGSISGTYQSTAKNIFNNAWTTNSDSTATEPASKASTLLVTPAMSENSDTLPLSLSMVEEEEGDHISTAKGIETYLLHHLKQQQENIKQLQFLHHQVQEFQDGSNGKEQDLTTVSLDLRSVYSQLEVCESFLYTKISVYVCHGCRSAVEGTNVVPIRGDDVSIKHRKLLMTNVPRNRFTSLPPSVSSSDMYNNSYQHTHSSPQLSYSSSIPSSYMNSNNKNRPSIMNGGSVAHDQQQSGRLSSLSGEEPGTPDSLYDYGGEEDDEGEDSEGRSLSSKDGQVRRTGTNRAARTLSSNASGSGSSSGSSAPTPRVMSSKSRSTTNSKKKRKNKGKNGNAGVMVTSVESLTCNTNNNFVMVDNSMSGETRASGIGGSQLSSMYDVNNVDVVVNKNGGHVHSHGYNHSQSHRPDTYDHFGNPVYESTCHMADCSGHGYVKTYEGRSSRHEPSYNINDPEQIEQMRIATEHARLAGYPDYDDEEEEEEDDDDFSPECMCPSCIHKPYGGDEYLDNESDQDYLDDDYYDDHVPHHCSNHTHGHQCNGGLGGGMQPKPNHDFHTARNKLRMKLQQQSIEQARRDEKEKKAKALNENAFVAPVDDLLQYIEGQAAKPLVNGPKRGKAEKRARKKREEEMKRKEEEVCAEKQRQIDQARDDAKQNQSAEVSVQQEDINLANMNVNAKNMSPSPTLKKKNNSNKKGAGMGLEGGLHSSTAETSCDSSQAVRKKNGMKGSKDESSFSGNNNSAKNTANASRSEERLFTANGSTSLTHKSMGGGGGVITSSTNSSTTSSSSSKKKKRGSSAKQDLKDYSEDEGFKSKMEELSIEDIFAPKKNGSASGNGVVGQQDDDYDHEVEELKRICAASLQPPTTRKKMSVDLNLIALAARSRS